MPERVFHEREGVSSSQLRQLNDGSRDSVHSQNQQSSRVEGRVLRCNFFLEFIIIKQLPHRGPYVANHAQFHMTGCVTQKLLNGHQSPSSLQSVDRHVGERKECALQ